MTPKLRSRLGRRFDNFNQLVDDAIAIEEDLRLHHIEKRKAKATVGSSGNAPQRPRMTYQAPPRPVFQPQRQQQMIVRPAQQQYPQRPQYYRPPQQQGNVRAPTPVSFAQNPCYNCGRPGHYTTSTSPSCTCLCANSASRPSQPEEERNSQDWTGSQHADSRRFYRNVSYGGYVFRKRSPRYSTL